MADNKVAGSGLRLAILDDYQGVAKTSADWSRIEGAVSIEVFSDTITDPDLLVQRLAPFDILCVMRERTPLGRTILERLPRLELIVSTGPKNSSIDLKAADEQGVVVQNTRGSLTAPIELTWALIQASARNLAEEAERLRTGGWQLTVGDELAGRTLGILGLGRIGTKIANIARAFDMNVITWGERTTAADAEAAGAELVSRERLFSDADILTIHLVLVEGTRGLVGNAELARMKRSAWLINTSRGPIVDEAALVSRLTNGQLAGAALDVFDEEPLPAHHPFRTLPNVLATPHLGYVSRQQYAVWYGDTVEHVHDWLRGRQDHQ